ncbi:manganese-dependent ADP-ribose CDP-alcohol diphosphatase [Brachionus plicatilis]|uniref:Manganese-dependent ADP-ribose CDP-alcohol diphosphatase n=1 Tax=Brachionus plicatilis TaxID=10195 RepID=A0A3M7QA99_BRAPC|nr:manganese-dependent ADP-ribose CDP-alcohol diphosphatase [Brachionus plicatilis]
MLFPNNFLLFNEMTELNVNFDKNCERTSNKLLTSIGLLSDIQYANIDDGTCHHNINERYYRNGLEMIRKIYKNFEAHESKHGTTISCIVQLGDLIDGKSKLNKSSNADLEECLNILKQKPSHSELLHIWGNHEFYNFFRKDLLISELNTAKILRSDWNENSNDYTFQVTSNLKLICLDFYEFSVIGYKGDEEIFQEARKYYDHVRRLNQRRFVMEREGSLSLRQLNWLSDELEKCEKDKNFAIVCGHVPILASPEKYLALKSTDILNLLWKFDRNVLAYISGHYHQGSYCLDQHNIHHITLPGIVECKPGTNPSIIIDIACPESEKLSNDHKFYDFTKTHPIKIWLSVSNTINLLNKIKKTRFQSSSKSYSTFNPSIRPNQLKAYYSTTKIPDDEILNDAESFPYQKVMKESNKEVMVCILHCPF